jgi:transcriptional regulator of heat shock response
MALLAVEQGTSIQFGSDFPSVDLDMAVVSKAYESGGGGGSVGVIGPMRMNYKRVISAVEEITRELEDRIGQTSG